MLLSLRGIARFYGQRLIFKNVSFAVAPGSITLLTGANGAGKSTLLKIMAGLVSPSAGEVVFGTPDDEAPSIGYLGHQTFLYPDLTALENLRFWAGMYRLRLSDDKLMTALERVDLAPFAEEKARVFSRGMAQRLSLARLFLHTPQVLLLDEPATGLDVRSAAMLTTAISDAKRRGAGIVWISHNLDHDGKLADDIAFLRDKTLAFYGPLRSFAGFSSQPRAAPSGHVEHGIPSVEIRAAQGGDLC